MKQFVHVCMSLAIFLALPTIFACSLGEETGSVSFSMQAPRGVGGTLYYETFILNAPGRVINYDDIQSTDSMPRTGSKNDMYLLSEASGSIVEGSTATITLDNVPVAEQASCFVFIADYPNFCSPSNMRSFDTMVAMYCGWQGFKEEGGQTYPTFSISSGNTTEISIDMKSEKDDNGLYPYMLYLDFPSGEDNPYTVVGSDEASIYISEIKIESMTDSFTAWTQSQSNYQHDIKKEKNIRLKLHQIFKNDIQSAGFFEKTESVTVTISIELCKQESESSGPTRTGKNYKGTVNTTTHRGGMSCVVAMKLQS